MKVREHAKAIVGEVETLKAGMRNKRLPLATRTAAVYVLGEIGVLLASIVMEIDRAVNEEAPELAREDPEFAAYLQPT